MRRFVSWPFIIIMTHGRPWRVYHSIMINVTWRHFYQSVKQLVVGHAANIFHRDTTRKQTKNHRYGNNRKMAAGFAYRIYNYSTSSRRHVIIVCRQRSASLWSDSRCLTNVKLILWMKMHRSNNTALKTLSGVNYYELLATCSKCSNDASDMSENIIAYPFFLIFVGPCLFSFPHF